MFFGLFFKKSKILYALLVKLKESTDVSREIIQMELLILETLV